MTFQAETTDPATSRGRPRRSGTPEPGLEQLQDRFVALWAQMAPGWGIARAMGEVHALLFIVGQPLNTDAVIARLGISRGSASMTLRRLEDWGMVERTNRPGDRKEYFSAEQDVWKMLRRIVQQRKKRELDPLLEALAACRHGSVVPAVPSSRTHAAMSSAAEASELREHDDRVTRLIELFQRLDSLGNRFVSPRGGRGLEVAARLLERARLDRGFGWLTRPEPAHSTPSATSAPPARRTPEAGDGLEVTTFLPNRFAPNHAAPNHLAPNHMAPNHAAPAGSNGWSRSTRPEASALGLRVCWTGCFADADRSPRHETSVVVELRAATESAGVLHAWIESPSGTRDLRRNLPVRLERFESEGRLHLDAYDDGLRVAAISLDSDHLVFARTPILAEAALGAGAFDPPALEFIADDAVGAARE